MLRNRLNVSKKPGKTVLRNRVKGLENQDKWAKKPGKHQNATYLVSNSDDVRLQDGSSSADLVHSAPLAAVDAGTVSPTSRIRLVADTLLVHGIIQFSNEKRVTVDWHALQRMVNTVSIGALYSGKASCT